MNDHAARPLPASPDAPALEIYVKPFVCCVCGKPIEHRGGGAWRHASLT